jgi:hypothetical protein
LYYVLNAVFPSLLLLLVLPQLADKSELIRKDVAAHEASSKLAGATRQLEESIREWVDEGAKMAQG